MCGCGHFTTLIALSIIKIMKIRIIKEPISKKELIALAKEQFGNMVKAVVDIEQEIMAVGGELHADEEVILMEKQDSKRENTWGINLYPEKLEQEWIEFNSMINIKPFLGNCSREIEDLAIKGKIRNIVKKLVI